MKKGIADKWVAALRSGDYKQGKNVLKSHTPGDDKPSFCCLGVLCDLAAKEGVGEWVVISPSFGGELFVCDRDGSDIRVLTHEVIKWSGMRSREGSTLPNSHSLTALNDSGKNFNHIADIIEKHWSDL